MVCLLGDLWTEVDRARANNVINPVEMDPLWISVFTMHLVEHMRSTVLSLQMFPTTCVEHEFMTYLKRHPMMMMIIASEERLSSIIHVPPNLLAVERRPSR